MDGLLKKILVSTLATTMLTTAEPQLSANDKSQIFLRDANSQQNLTNASFKEGCLEELLAYFNETKKDFWDYNQLKDYSVESKNFLKEYTINPQIINEFNLHIQRQSLSKAEKWYLGIFLSAMIQTSYDQGFNDFSFEEINAHGFGTFLKGKNGDKLMIKVGTITGYDTLAKSKNCSLEAKTIIGGWTLWFAKKSTLTVETLKGDYSLRYAENCTAEITNYEGQNFGYGITNCKIYSSNPNVLEKIKRQIQLGTKKLF
ncbi:hypothetical protein HY643_05170 [Candidatus Woesearchaeota archaeon]|nr:hypothetical protein [Candidatus Woesearchaeota archaeon]